MNHKVWIDGEEEPQDWCDDKGESSHGVAIRHLTNNRRHTATVIVRYETSQKVFQFENGFIVSFRATNTGVHS